MSIRTAIRDWLNAPSREEDYREREAKERIERASFYERPWGEREVQDRIKREAFYEVYNAGAECGRPWWSWVKRPPAANVQVEIISPEDPTIRILSWREIPPVIDGVYWRVARPLSGWRNDLGQAPLGGAEDQPPHLVSPRGRTTEAGGGR